MTITREGAEWLNMRGIDIEVAVSEGLFSAAPNGSDHRAWIGFPYIRNGRQVGCKYRNTKQKDFVQDKGSDQCLYRFDKLEGAKTVVICEGEIDALSAVMAGYPAATSVPGGAPQETGQKAHKYFEDAQKILREADSIILAFDQDGPGWALFEDALVVLGRTRCKFVEYPAGCKDLNDVLMLEGPERVRALLQAAKDVPVDGIYKPSELPELPPMEVFRVGLGQTFDKHIGIVKGQTSVWTGFANHGKSLMLKQVATELARNHGWVCGGVFMEDDYQRNFKGEILAAYSGYQPKVVSLEDRRAFEEFYERHWRLVKAPEDESVKLSWLYERMEALVRRHGADIIIIDPFTELDLELMPRETERERIGEILTEFNRFARRFNVHIAIVAHPTKPGRDGEKHPPLGYDVSGAAHWKNKPFLGVTVHKDPDVDNFAQIVVWKSKHRDPMGPCGSFIMRYDPPSSTYKAAVITEYEALLASARGGISGSVS